MSKTSTAFTAAAAVMFAATMADAQGNSGHVPPGQMPPAGMCRVWVDGVPPGRQAQVTDCATARAHQTANSHIIYGASARGRDAVDPRYPGTYGNDPRYPGTNSNDPRYDPRSGTYDPRYDSRSSTYDPRYDSRSSTYDPRYDSRTRDYDPRLDPRNRAYDARYAERYNDGKNNKNKKDHRGKRKDKDDRDDDDRRPNR